MSIQIVSYSSNTPPPPYTPPHRPAHTHALPSPARMKNKRITTWALSVQPGSPAPRSPHSPCRRPSTTTSRNRKSSFRFNTPSSFLNILDTPSTQGQRTTTPSLRDFKPDLTAVGYTSVFIPLPNTPFTATLPSMQKNTPPMPATATKSDYSHIPIPPIPSSSIKNGHIVKRFRSASLSILRPGRSRSKSTSNIPTPSSPSPNPKGKSKSKKAKYAHLRPPPLINDLALIQFADGGDLESNIKRMTEARAKANGGGVGDVYRDAEGGIWWDADEEWEYAHLLDGGNTGVGMGSGGKEEWVQFGEDGKEIERRESVTTVSTRDSDLDMDMHCVVQPIDDESRSGDLTALGSSLASHTLTQSKSILSTPQRPSKHYKAEYIAEVDAFTCPPTPTAGDGTYSSKQRRRPAPLKLTPAYNYKRPSNSPGSASSAKRYFLASSFAPPMQEATVGVGKRGVMRKASMKNVKAFFKSK